MRYRNLKSSQRISPETSAPLIRRLAAYSATAGAALLAAPATEAAIQNLVTFSYDGGSTFNATAPDGTISHSSWNSLNFTAASAGHNAGFKGYFRLQTGASAPLFGIVEMGAYVANHTLSAHASKLVFGASIINRNFGGPYLTHLLASRSNPGGPGPGSSTAFGDFAPAGPDATATGYVAFKTNLRSQTYYGWLHVKVSNNASGVPAEVSLISKNGDPGVFGAFSLASDNLTAGETALAAPEPSVAAIDGLGLLALGAAGVRELRRRKAAARK
jgi:hypothetical protein